MRDWGTYEVVSVFTGHQLHQEPIKDFRQAVRTAKVVHKDRKGEADYQYTYVYSPRGSRVMRFYDNKQAGKE